MTFFPRQTWLFPAAAGLTTVVVGVSSCCLLYTLPGPLGFDGYYYMLQVEGVLDRGVPYFRTSTPAAFYIQALFALLTGNVTGAIKISIIVATLCLFFLVYRATYEDTNDKWAALVGSSAFVLATPFKYVQVEFVKTLLGLTFVFVAWLFLKTHLRTRSVGSLISGLGFLLVAALNHKTSAVMGSILLATFICHSQGWLEVVSRYCWRSLAGTATCVLTLIPVLLLGACYVSARNHEHILRLVSHLSSTDISLVWLPLVIGLFGVSCLLRDRDLRIRPFEPSLSFSRCFMAIVSCFAVIVVVLRFFNLGPLLNQLGDRACLAFLPFLGIHIGLCINQAKCRRRPLWSGVCAVCSLTLFLPAVPPGISYWKSFPTLTTPSRIEQRLLSSRDVVVAPHGVEFLLIAKYKFNAAQFLVNVHNAGSRYLFITKERSSLNRSDRRCDIDLGGACLIKEVDDDALSSRN